MMQLAGLAAYGYNGELAELLAGFIKYYNDRPHQGLAIPGLSPDEFAGRIWLMQSVSRRVQAR